MPNWHFKFLFQQSKNCFWCEAHLDNGTQSMPHILHRSTKQPHLIIHYQIAVMDMLRQLHLLNLRTLFVMLLKIQLRLFGISRMHSAIHTCSSLVEQYQRTLIHKIVN